MCWSKYHINVSYFYHCYYFFEVKKIHSWNSCCIICDLFSIHPHSGNTYDKTIGINLYRIELIHIFFLVCKVHIKISKMFSLIVVVSLANSYPGQFSCLSIFAQSTKKPLQTRNGMLELVGLEMHLLEAYLHIHFKKSHCKIGRE